MLKRSSSSFFRSVLNGQRDKIKTRGGKRWRPITLTVPKKSITGEGDVAQVFEFDVKEREMTRDSIAKGKKCLENYLKRFENISKYYDLSIYRRRILKIVSTYEDFSWSEMRSRSRKFLNLLRSSYQLRFAIRKREWI